MMHEKIFLYKEKTLKLLSNLFRKKEKDTSVADYI